MMAAFRVFVLALCLVVAAHCSVVRQTEDDIAQLEQFIEQKKKDINPRYRLQYHVAGPVGWINDPNGFSYYNGQFHLFYQYYPYDSVWGPMHWGHSTSPDLVHWYQQPTALIPEEEQCFSGSAVQDGNSMVLMYTAHKGIDVPPYYNESQYLAYSDDGVYFHKYEGNPVLPAAPNSAPDFRDPKMWRHGDHWYVIIGSKTSDNRGRVLLYRSKDLKSWDFLNVLAESSGDLGYMWECPDFFELDGRFVLLWSPQGMDPQGDRYKNTFQTGYILGKFNYDTFEFVQETAFQELDFGHDFYASQTTEVDGKRYSVAWFSMWEVPHPEEVDGWSGAMTLIRELKISGDRILMKPVDEIINLRNYDIAPQIREFQPNHVIELEKASELIVKADLSRKFELLFEGVNGDGDIRVRWNPDVQKMAVDRYGDIRQVEWHPIGSHDLRIFLDASSLELFCGEGEVVFSSRVYPLGKWRVINVSSEQTLLIEGYALRRSVPE